MDEPRQVDWSAHLEAPTSVIVRLGDWPNGLYFARLTAPDGQSYDAPFVLRPHEYGLHRVAVILHTNTWQAYNHQDVDGDGWGDTWYAGPPVQTVALDRPYLHRGVPPFFYRYDQGFLHWLYWTGKTVDFLAEPDLEALSGDQLAADYNLVDNPANRYSIGDRTPGVAKDPDGGMTLSIQAASPGADKESNWLPCPAEGTWFLILRMYQPHDEVVQATWRCPAVRRIG